MSAPRNTILRRGGISPERQAFYSSPEWSECVRIVWQRDQATCQRCGVRATKRGEFHIHHRVSFAVRDLRADPSNLVLLCKECHGWVHSRLNATGEFIEEGGGAK